MKKLALTSLLAFMAVSGAHAANVIDGNPLYMPKAGHFYSVTSLGSHTEGTPYALGEEFGYGVMDNLAVDVSTSLTEDKGFDEYTWNNLALKATFRAFEEGGVVADVYGEYAAGGSAFVNRMSAPFGLASSLMYYPNAKDHTEWFDKDLTSYIWAAGVRAGYTTGEFTIAGHIGYSYVNSESFNIGDKGTHMVSFGLDGQFVIDSNWNLVAGAEYTGITNDHLAYDDDEFPGKVENAGVWTGYFGVNYNIDATKYVGAYVSGSMDHWKDDAYVEKGWDVEKGFGYGVKFGIDF